MTLSKFSDEYLLSITKWAGTEVSINEDFDLVCPSEVDFIEILLLGEKEFCLNLLEGNRERQDFTTMKDFVGWAFYQACSKTTLMS